MGEKKVVSAIYLHKLPQLPSYGCFQNIGGNTPKWMVKIMENPYKKMDDFLGEKPTILGNR